MQRRARADPCARTRARGTRRRDAPRATMRATARGAARARTSVAASSRLGAFYVGRGAPMAIATPARDGGGDGDGRRRSDGGTRDGGEARDATTASMRWCTRARRARAGRR